MSEHTEDTERLQSVSGSNLRTLSRADAHLFGYEGGYNKVVELTSATSRYE